MKMKSLGAIIVLGSILVPGIFVEAYGENRASVDKTSISGKTLVSNQIVASSKTESEKTSGSCILHQEVINAEKAWGDAIVAIGKAYTSKGDYKGLAEQTVDKLYAYDEGTVLFKPTKAAQEQFRLTKQEATSYFVKGVVPEDHGFAIQPWSKVRFENVGTIISCNYALTMGNYYFTDRNSGKEAKVEFTFGYRKSKDGRLVIDLHHSSFPYNSVN